MDPDDVRDFTGTSGAHCTQITVKEIVEMVKAEWRVRGLKVWILEKVKSEWVPHQRN